MTESPESRNQTQNKADPRGKEGSTRRPAGWRSVARVVVAATAGFLVLATVHQMRYEPVAIGGAYEWTLRWPGTTPGAKFKTRSGDATRRLLDLLLADAGADWQAPLSQAGTIEIQLSRSAYPSLWTLLKWRILGPPGPGALGKAEQVLLVVQVNETDQSPPRYAIVSTDSDGRQTAQETYDDYSEAQQAVLDELARVMDEVQT